MISFNDRTQVQWNENKRQRCLKEQRLLQSLSKSKLSTKMTKEKHSPFVYINQVGTIYLATAIFRKYYTLYI